MLECHEENGRRLYTATRGSTVLGLIAIDSVINGSARGGLRLLPDVTAAEIRDAARAMTLKYGFLGLPQGGAKAGVRGGDEATPEERRARLTEFAQVARPLLEQRIYVPDSDMGTDAEDIQSMMRSVGARINRQEWRTHRSGLYTAVSCLASAEVALGRREKTWTGRTVAIEGFGSVGGNLAQLLHLRGARVVAVSSAEGAVHDDQGLDVERLRDLANRYGSGFVHHVPSRNRLKRTALLELPVDLLCPCARRHSIDRQTVDRVAAPLICAGANDPVSPEAERMLFERDVLVMPDFVTNSGGVLGGTLEFAGVSSDRVAELLQQFLGSRVKKILDNAERRGVPPREIAETEALDRHARVRESAENPSPLGRLTGLALRAYRRGWVPRRLVARIAPRYLQRLSRT